MPITRRYDIWGLDDKDNQVEGTLTTGIVGNRKAIDMANSLFDTIPQVQTVVVARHPIADRTESTK